MNNISKKLDPNWITGFTDAEGCFCIGISKRHNLKTGWFISPIFSIELHNKDIIVLEKIKLFFNCGRHSNNKNWTKFIVTDLKSINNIIIPHFEKYPLITQKQGDFLLWKSIIELMGKKEHLNIESLMEIIKIRASLNWGLSDKLKFHFPNIIKVEKPKINLPKFINPYWFAGFFSGDGCFQIKIQENTIYKGNYHVSLTLTLGQHLKDELLIKYLVNYFNCGTTHKFSSKNYIVFTTSKFKDIYLKIIPFFKKYNIQGIKALDFLDFCLAADLINNKVHLTIKGLEKIRLIKSQMNKARNIKY